MGRSAWGARGCVAVVLMAGYFTVPVSAQQASSPPAPAGSAAPSAEPGPELPVSVDRIRQGLAQEPALRLDSRPVFRVEIQERRPRYWDLQSPFLFPVEPRTTTTRWHDEFVNMVTPEEARLYSPMLSGSETATIAATSLLFAGAAALLKAGFLEWRQNRLDGRAREAREEVDAALAEWEATRR